jgi:hypothetical protein
MRWIAIMLTLSVALGSQAVGAAGAKTAAGAHNLVERHGYVWVQRAIDLAAKKFARAQCQKVFTDFANADGVPLSSVLARLKTTPEDYLTQWILFTEGDRERQCLTKDIAAFTQTGSRVIYVCSSRFTMQPIPNGVVIVIHEMLHSLGLGEQPPTSAEITKRIGERCGG